MNIIVDYGMGNFRSIQSKIKMLELESEISSDPKVIEKADRLILPGVGHYGTAMKNLKDRNLFDVLREKALVRKTPFLGICLGMQLLGTHSEEGDAKGLGLIEFDVIRFQNSKIRVPHVGWNDLKLEKSDSILFNNVNISNTFYFTHSYHAAKVNTQSICATTDYEDNFVSVVEKDNIYGTQFHPEKSRINGLKIIENFLKST